MNKLLKIILATLAGLDTTMYIFTPLIIVVLWDTINNLEGFRLVLFYSLGFGSLIFRAIKIGMLKK